MMAVQIESFSKYKSWFNKEAGGWPSQQQQRASPDLSVD
jgi:hypothetical protein